MALQLGAAVAWLPRLPGVRDVLDAVTVEVAGRDARRVVERLVQERAEALHVEALFVRS